MEGPHQGGWHARRDWSAHAWSWRQALEALQARHGVTPLFAATLTWRGNDTALLLRPAGLGLPHASFYQAPSDAEAVKAYKVLLKDTALSLGASTQDAARFADDIFSFEKRLADIILGADGGLAETTMTLQSLSKTTVNSMLRAMFPLISISGRTEVVVAAPHYITYLLSVTTSTSDSILNDYFTWTLIREYLPYMSKSYQLIWREYQSHITGSTDDLSRWEFCAGLVQKTAPLATLALLQAQGEAEFSRHDGSFRATQHAAVNEIFETIKTVAVDTVTSSTVVDAETKSLMLEQLSGLNLQIGLRVHEMSPEFLRKYHKGFVVQKHDLFRNIGNALEFERELVQNAYNEKEVGIVRDNARKLISAEASYNSHTKTITFPSALAELPYFHTDYPRFVKYARAGATIGAAVADALGAAAEYNASAEVQVPPHAEPAFHCFLESLQGSVHANLSQPRAAAASLNRRVLGASLALGAARTISDDSMLPLLGDYYRDTLFALSYAQSLCSMHTPEQALLDGINFQIDGETMFEVAWPQIEGIQQALHCSIKEKCPSAL